jgi:hypothetical protein
MGKRPRKDFDLRKFWPWYGRSWNPWPPFRLSDLDPPEQQIRGRRFFQVLTVLAGIGLVWFVLWLVFQ